MYHLGAGISEISQKQTGVNERNSSHNNENSVIVCIPSCGGPTSPRWWKKIWDERKNYISKHLHSLTKHWCSPNKLGVLSHKTFVFNSLFAMRTPEGDQGNPLSSCVPLRNVAISCKTFVFSCKILVFRKKTRVQLKI